MGQKDKVLLSEEFLAPSGTGKNETLLLQVRLRIEPIELWKGYYRDCHFSNVEVLEVTFAKKIWIERGGVFEPKWHPVSLYSNKSLVSAHHPVRWHTSHDSCWSMAIGGIPDSRGVFWSWENCFCWLVTSEGHDVPLIPEPIQPTWNLRRKCHTLRPLYRNLRSGGSAFDRLLVLRRITIQTPTAIGLYYNDCLLDDSFDYPFQILMQVYCDVIREPDNQSVWHLIRLLEKRIQELARLKEERDGFQNCIQATIDARDEFMRSYNTTRHRNFDMQKWLIEFFDEAIPRFDATKRVSRAKVMGEFRKFLEEKQSEFREKFPS